MEDAEPKIPVSIALPPSLRVRLDAEATRQDRSRSWLTAEAIKEYLARRAEAGDAGRR
jgi:predicted transcriptional regulator